MDDTHIQNTTKKSYSWHQASLYLLKNQSYRNSQFIIMTKTKREGDNTMLRQTIVYKKIYRLPHNNLNHIYKHLKYIICRMETVKANIYSYFMEYLKIQKK